MTSCVVFFLSSSLPVTISYKYFTFSRSAIFNLAFSFPFKLREELLTSRNLGQAYRRLKSSIVQFLVTLLKILVLTNVIVVEKSWQGKSDQSDNFDRRSKFLDMSTIHVTVFFDSPFSGKYHKAFILISCHLVSFSHTRLFTFLSR
jgi:hypothetical protein